METEPNNATIADKSDSGANDGNEGDGQRVAGDATLLMAEASSGQAKDKAPGVVSECDGQLGDGDATFLAVAASGQATATGVDGCVTDARMDLDPDELMVSPGKSRLVLLHAAARTARMLRRLGRSHCMGLGKNLQARMDESEPNQKEFEGIGNPIMRQSWQS